MGPIPKKNRYKKQRQGLVDYLRNTKEVWPKLFPDLEKYFSRGEAIKIHNYFQKTETLWKELKAEDSNDEK